MSLEVVTIIVICDPENFNSLKQVIDAHSAETAVVVLATNLTSLRESVRSAGSRIRLVSYLNNEIIPADIIRSFDLGAYNFHPGTPEYPGTAPDAWACYEEAESYGATLHEMSEKVDEGRIIEVSRVPIPPRSHRLVYTDVACKMAYSLFCLVAQKLISADIIASNDDFTWSGKKRTIADYQSMVQLQPDITKEELFKRIFCFGPPEVAGFSVTLHGVKFIMMTLTGFKGHFDPIKDGFVRGWAHSMAYPSLRLELRIVVDGKVDHFIKADQYRDDVHSAGHGDGFSGFSWEIPMEYRDGRLHNIEITVAGTPLMGSPRLYSHQNINE